MIEGNEGGVSIESQGQARNEEIIKPVDRKEQSPKKRATCHVTSPEGRRQEIWSFPYDPDACNKPHFP